MEIYEIKNQWVLCQLQAMQSAILVLLAAPALRAGLR